MDAFTRAATNRSLRTIQTELDFLCDASVLTAAQVSQIAAILPSSASRASTTSNTRTESSNPTPAPALPAREPSVHSPIHSPVGNSYYSEKQHQPAAPEPAHSPAPPSYSAHSPPPGGAGGIATVSALYPYRPTDAGDLELAAGDRVTVLEWMNADWARGRSQRSGAEGIFPRSYAKVLEEEKGPSPYAQAPAPWHNNAMPYHNPPPPQQGGGYGNMPVEVAQGDPNQQNGQPSKVNTQGKKFGKKLGNAAIFGAGATIGSNIVNGIL